MTIEQFALRLNALELEKVESMIQLLDELVDRDTSDSPAAYVAENKARLALAQDRRRRLVATAERIQAVQAAR